MNPLKKLVGQTATYGLSSILGRFLNYLLVFLHSSVFATDEYGINAELYAYATFLLIVLTFGMETAFFRFASEKDEKRDVYSTSFLSLVVTSTIFVVLTILFSGSIAEFLKYPDQWIYVVIFGLIIGLDVSCAIPFAYLRQQNRPIRFMSIRLINIGINIALNLFFLLLCPYLLKGNPDSVVKHIYHREFGVGYIFLANLVASFVTLLMLSPYFLKIKLRFDKKLFREMLKYALPLLVAGLAGMINETFDRILLKFLIVVPEGVANGTKYIFGQIGIYSANYRISVMMTLFIQAFRYAAEPFFFSQGNGQKTKQLYADVMKYFIIFGLLIFLGVLFYLDQIAYFLGRDYHEGLHIVPVLLLANLFLGIVFNLSIWYKLNNKTMYGAVITIFGAIITIVLNVILIPKIGYTGSAWATLVCYILMALLSYILGQKHYTVKYDLKNIAFYFIFALVLYFISIYFIVDNLIIKFVINTIYFIFFIFVAIYREKFYKFIRPKRKQS